MSSACGAIESSTVSPTLVVSAITGERPRGRDPDRACPRVRDAGAAEVRAAAKAGEQAEQRAAAAVDRDDVEQAVAGVRRSDAQAGAEERHVRDEELADAHEAAAAVERRARR